MFSATTQSAIAMGLKKLEPSQARTSAARAGSAAGGTARSLVPSASELGEVFVGANQPAPTTVPGKKADVLLSVLQYNNDATIYGANFQKGT